MAGVQLHVLLLKKNCPIILLRNIDPSKGLSNDTRLICQNSSRNVINPKIRIGHSSENIVFIPRILFIPNKDETDKFSFKRTHFQSDLV